MKTRSLSNFLRVLLAAVILTAGCLPLSSAELSEEDEAVIEVFLNNTQISDAMAAFYTGRALYLPPNQVLHMLEFAPLTNTSTFKDAKYYRGQLFLPSSDIENLIDGRVEFDFAGQKIILSSKNKNFPIEERLAREERKKALAKKEPAKKIPKEDIIKGTDKFQFPFADFSAGYFYNKNAATPSDTNYGASLHLFGITGAWDSELMFQNLDYYNPASLRLKTSRYYEDEEELFGIVKKIDLGDISASGSSASSGIVNGVGAAITSYPDDVITEKTYSIREAVPLGWEVELYRGGELLGVRRGGADGFFEFENIVLYQGQNKFELIFYGPQGQIRKEERILFYRGNLLDKGRFGLRAYAMDKNETLTNTGAQYDSDFTGAAALVSAAYGVTDNFTISAQAISEPVTLFKDYAYHKKEKQFASAGMSFMFHPVYVNIESVADFEQSAASLDLVLQTELYGFSVNAENNYFGGIITNKNIIFDRIIENYSNLSVNKSLNITKFLTLPFTVNYTRMQDTLSQKQNEVYVSIYQGLPVQVYMGAGYRYINNFDGYEQEFLNMYLSRFFGRHSLRLDGDYNLDLHKVSALGANFTFYLLKNLDGALRYNRTISDYERSKYFDRFSAGLNLRTAWGYFNVDAGIAEDNSKYVTAGYSISLGYDARNKKLLHSPDKIYDSGVIAARAYSSGKTVVENPPFFIQPSSGNKELVEAKNGYSYFPFLNKYTPYQVNLDIDELDSGPDLLPPDNPLYARVRPGEIVYVDYPLKESAYIEGRVNFKPRRGQANGLGGIRLKLMDVDTNKQVDSILSDYDGYFTFEKLPLGRYRIVPDYRQLHSLKYEFKECGVMKLKDAGEYFECSVKVENM